MQVFENLVSNTNKAAPYKTRDMLQQITQEQCTNHKDLRLGKVAYALDFSLQHFVVQLQIYSFMA